MINLDNLKNISRHNSAFIREILEVYLTNTPQDLEKMGQAVDQEDWQIVRYFAHKLKSSSFTIGFDNGHRQFQEIEHIIKNDQDKEEVPALFNEAVVSCDECIKAVKIELTKYI